MRQHRHTCGTLLRGVCALELPRAKLLPFPLESAPALDLSFFESKKPMAGGGGLESLKAFRLDVLELVKREGTAFKPAYSLGKSSGTRF